MFNLPTWKGSRRFSNNIMMEILICRVGEADAATEK